MAAVHSVVFRMAAAAAAYAAVLAVLVGTASSDAFVSIPRPPPPPRCSSALDPHRFRKQHHSKFDISVGAAPSALFLLRGRMSITISPGHLCFSIDPYASTRPYDGKGTPILRSESRMRRFRIEASASRSSLNANEQDEDPNSSNSSSNNNNYSNSNISGDMNSNFKRRNQQWIVMVDDEESIRFAVGDFLYEQGYEVTACADAQSLLDLIVSRNQNQNYQQQQQQQQSSESKQLRFRLPDLIISDVRMPESDKNGYELVDFLRNVSSRREQLRQKTAGANTLVDHKSAWRSLENIPIVLLTAKAMTEDRIMGYKAGADIVLPKPFAPEELVSIVDNLIRLREQRLRKQRKPPPPPPVTTTTIPHRESAANDNDIQETYRYLKRELETIKNAMQQNTANIVEQTNVVLNQKERRILELLAEGNTPREIAKQVSSSSPNHNSNNNNNKKTKAAAEKEKITAIRKIIDALVEKSESGSKTELIRWARRVGYIRL